MNDAAPVTYEELRTSGDVFEEALKPLRAMVHRVCRLTNAATTCPYLREHGKLDTEACRTCPLDKERMRERSESSGCE